MKLKHLVILIIFLVVSIAVFSAAQGEDPTNEDKMALALKNYIQVNYPDFKDAKIKVKLEMPTGIFSEMQAKAQEWQFKVEPNFSKFRPFGRVTIPFEATPKQGGARKLFVNATVAVYQKVLVAKDDLRKGRLVSPESFALEEKEVAKTSQKYYTEAKKIIGKQLTTNVKAGQVLFDWMLREKPLIARGDKVAVLASINNVQVITNAVALDEGWQGDLIRVRVDGTRKVLRVKVENAGQTRLDVK